MKNESSPHKKETVNRVVERIVFLPQYRRDAITEEEKSPASAPERSIMHRNDYYDDPCDHRSDPVASVSQAYVVVPSTAITYDYDPQREPLHKGDLSPTNPDYKRYFKV